MANGNMVTNGTAALPNIGLETDHSLHPLKQLK
jgi:hypothetical protein